MTSPVLSVPQPVREQNRSLGRRLAHQHVHQTAAAASPEPWAGELPARGVSLVTDHDLAVAHVAERVKTGGHHVPEAAARRRFARGRHNFFALYRNLADAWRLYEASSI